MAANYGQAASGIGGIAAGAESIAGAAGDIMTAQGEEEAAGLFGQAATIAENSSIQAQFTGKLQQVQNARAVMMTQGTAMTAAAAGGLKIGGSAAAILRSNAGQGALANQLIGENTQINVNSFMQQNIADTEQQQNALSQADAEKVAAAGAGIGGALDIIGGIVSIAGSGAL
jgi:hypothetical protein